ncbi:MAG: hypothetical protein FJ271_17265 [Planctomycetes bacterium]|nr:hypothetical protein [Planctomycetota bacterium]
MDCNHARMLLIVCRDAVDLDGDEAAALNSHLAQCGACLSWSAGERRWEKAVARVMRAVPIPADVKGRALSRLARSRPPISRYWPVWTAAAAVLLLTAGLSWFWWWRSPMPIDLALAENDVVVKMHATPESVEEWFQAKGVTMAAPRQFNYDLLQDFDLAEFHGRRVPRLKFFSARTGRFAEVYILAERQFTHDPEAPQQFSGTTLTVQMLEPSSGFRYLIVFSGDSLEPFLRIRDAV